MTNVEGPQLILPIESHTNHNNFLNNISPPSINSFSSILSQNGNNTPLISTSSSASSTSNLTLNQSQNDHEQQQHEQKRSNDLECDYPLKNIESANGLSNSSTCVRVAVRVRPLSTREQIELCKVCTHVTPGEPQVTLGSKDDKSFTYDYVFDMHEAQNAIFANSVRTLLDGCLDGFNATVLAYGQTGKILFSVYF
jgi:hypothetical protein